MEEREDPRDESDSANNELEREVAGLYEQYAAGLLRYAQAVTRNQDAGRDAVQEVFLKYFVERRYGSQVHNPRAWLFRVLRNHLLDRLSQAAMKFEVSSEFAEQVPDGRRDAEMLLQETQAAQAIASRLTTRELDCLRLRAEGFAYREIADTLGVRLGTVGALLPRAYSKLREGAAEGIFLWERTAGALAFLVRGRQPRAS